jgi:hypothetical protein
VFGKIVILDHPGYVQSFHKDRLVLAYDLRREFLKRIPSAIADSGVQSGYSEPGFLSIITILDLTREATLKYLQSLLTLNERARIFDLLALTGHSQRLNTDINADFGFGLFESFDIGFNQDADKIASTGVPADSQVEDFSVIGKRAAPNNVERFGLLGQCDATLFKCEGIGSVASRLAMEARFKFRIPGSLLEEVGESSIEIAQRLLKNNRADLGKKFFVRFLFPLCEFQGGIVIANGFVFLAPGFAAICQGLIINKASAAEGSGKLCGLRIRGEESIFKSLLDNHVGILQHMSNLCNYS